MKKIFISQKMRFLLVLAFVFSFSTQSNAQWKTVRTGGGGAITSIQAHPKVQNLYFITTDVGTPYRWNSTTQAWEGLFYNLPANYWSKNAAGNIAFDPSDATGNVLYATIGPKPTGGVMKSTDRGSTWIDCQLPLNVIPNSDQSYGQRLAVDPNNSNVVYVTTRPSTTGVTTINGTFKSIDAGNTWTKINNLCGAFLSFDVSGGTTSGVTKNIFIGCTDGVYQSVNGGADFTLMAGSPTNSSRAAIHSNGKLYITHFKSVAKWDGSAWFDITPPAAYIYSAIDVNPNNSDQLIVGQGSSNPYKFDQYVSSNGGSSWTLLKLVKDVSEVPWFNSTIGQGLKDFCWDPFDQNMVWFTDFFNPFQTTNIWAGTNVTWKARAEGEEETCATGNMLCPPSGDNVLLSNAADVGGFDHKSLTSPPTVGMITHFPWSFSGEAGNMTGVAVEEANPNFIARVGRHGWSGTGYAGYSTDGGLTYTNWACPSDAAGGRIAVSANSETMIWVTQSGPCYRSINRGANWSQIFSLPLSIIAGGNNVFTSGSVNPIAADKVNGNKFYVFNAGKMYVSTDGGSTFVAGAINLPAPYITNPLAVETTPDKEGDVWIAMGFNGLFHSTNSGASFVQIANVDIASSISIGKGSPSAPNIPAVYVYGMINGIANSLFRTYDNGTTWEIINAPLHIGGSAYNMAADRQVFGRVFFGTSGNGILYIENIVDNLSPTAPTALTSAKLTTNSARLLWTASTDNVAVASYSIYQDGVFKGSATGGAGSTYNLTGLTAGTTYTITVKAKDAAGNLSAPATLTVTTPSVNVSPVNIALNKPVTVSVGSTTASLGNDGIASTGWSASGVPNWYDIDLGANYNITGAEIIWGHPIWVYYYKIEVSTDNSTWVMASDKTSNTYYGPLSEINNFTANGYRYIRFTITGWENGGYSSSTNEFMVYGSVIDGIGNVTNSSVKIYPNPTTDYLSIEDISLNASVTILTSNGIIVYNNRITNSNNLTLSVKNWAKGMYLIRVKDEGRITVKKVVVQ